MRLIGTYRKTLDGERFTRWLGREAASEMFLHPLPQKFLAKKPKATTKVVLRATMKCYSKELGNHNAHTSLEISNPTKCCKLSSTIIKHEPLLFSFDIELHGFPSTIGNEERSRLLNNHLPQWLQSELLTIRPRLLRNILNKP